MFVFTTGCILAWNSPVLVQLQSNDTVINPLGRPLTVIEVSISSAIVPVGSTLGSIFIGKISDIFGRRASLTYLAVGVIISFTGICFASHVYVYFTCFLIATICTTAGFLIVPVYVTEIAEDNNRGLMGCFLSIAISLGHLYVYVLGPITSVGMLSLLCGAPSALFLIFSLYLPESPIFLATKKEKSKALAALKKLRKNKSPTELKLEYKEKQRMLEDTSKEDVKGIRILFMTRSGRKAIILSLIITITQHLSGVSIVLSFMGPLIKEASSNLSENISTIIIGAANIPVSILALFLIEKQGRRFLFLVATFFDGLSMFVLGLFFVFKDSDLSLPESVKFVPVLCLLVYMTMFTFGLATVPQVVTSELLPNEVRSVGCSLVMVVGNLTACVVAFAYPIVSDLLGIYTCMFAFSLSCFSGFILVYFMLPETKGKSLIEIKRALEK